MLMEFTQPSALDNAAASSSASQVLGSQEALHLVRGGKLGIEEAHTQKVLRGHKRGSLWERRTKSSSQHLLLHFRP